MKIPTSQHQPGDFHRFDPVTQRVMGMQLMAMRVPSSESGASQVTVVPPLNQEVSSVWLGGASRSLPVVTDDGDGRAAQPDVNEEAG